MPQVEPGNSFKIGYNCLRESKVVFTIFSLLFWIWGIEFLSWNLFGIIYEWIEWAEFLQKKKEKRKKRVRWISSVKSEETVMSLVLIWIWRCENINILCWFCGPWEWQHGENNRFCGPFLSFPYTTRWYSMDRLIGSNVQFRAKRMIRDIHSCFTVNFLVAYHCMESSLSLYQDGPRPKSHNSLVWLAGERTWLFSILLFLAQVFSTFLERGRIAAEGRKSFTFYSVSFHIFL